MEKLYCIWLSTIKYLKYETFRKLYLSFGSFKAVYEADKEQLLNCTKLTPMELQGLLDKNTSHADEILYQCDKTDIGIISCFDENYPKLLLDIQNPPKVLYIKGNVRELNKLVTINVVGSRLPTTYGNKMGFKFGYELASEGLTVVSGMARGIDSQSHRGALKAGGKTVAVLGNGCNVVYPPENAPLMEIILNNGCVISEYPPYDGTDRYKFPHRNRIMAGMSLGTLVVEGARRSGTLITSRLALEQGKNVYCVPGNIDNPNSFVPNEIIKDGGVIVTSPADIIIDLTASYPELMLEKILKGEQKVADSNKLANVTEEQRQILYFLNKNTPVHIDEICKLTGKPIGTVTQNLMMLEISKLVVSMPGRYYILK
ncbi:MAG: DNA-processing protein DprA [Clostridia bacterium]|nr:DNA-processing protein DprA [Clostridia bacterium]MBQ9997952.1 DNA-processing protein DprA [Clostridia bacterium]